MSDGSAADSLDVLLVEDDPALSEMYRLKLVQDGYQVRLASDGESGLEAALRRPPDLLLLDLRLPNLSGFELLERLRRVPGWIDPPVIVLSNYGDLEVIKRGQALGRPGAPDQVPDHSGLPHRDDQTPAAGWSTSPDYGVSSGSSTSGSHPTTVPVRPARGASTSSASAYTAFLTLSPVSGSSFV